MNFFKLKNAAAKNEKLAGIFTIVFVIAMLVTWAIGQTGFYTEFFQYIAVLLSQFTMGLTIAFAICRLVGAWADSKICKGLPKRMY